MIKSMTGFGIGESFTERYYFNVEIKTVNHRYSDIVIRMPKYLNFLEDNIKARIKDKINRGRVEVYIKLGYIDEAGKDIKIDLQLAKVYKDKLVELIDELQIKDDIKLSDILSVPEIIQIESKEIDNDSIWDDLKIALEIALESVMSMRINEGIELKKDMEKQLLNVQELVEKIEYRAPLVITEYKNKLKERIEELLEEDFNVDEDRLNYEIVFFADKSDITEEVTRFKSHIKQFLNCLIDEDVVGRKLDFLIQEMNREVNTIGSKSSDIDICNFVVDIKSGLEKIREQVQNIE